LRRGPTVLNKIIEYDFCNQILSNRVSSLMIFVRKKCVSRRFVSRALACAFAAAALFSTGCEKKPQPLTGIQVRAITREMVFAAKNASNGRVQTGMFPERAGDAEGQRRSDPGGRDQTPPLPPADLIFISLPHIEGGKTDESALTAVVNELDRVAQVHQLAHVQRPGAPGLFRYDYFYAGRRTHTINIVTPVVAPADTQHASHARLAIIIDDLGNDSDAAETLFQLPFPLTVSVLPLLRHSTEISEEASRRGYQVMLHIPIAAPASAKAESVELRPGMEPDQVTNLVQQMLETVPQAEGANNHQGSVGTSDAALMDAIMPALHERELFFVDSRTSAATVAYSAARRAHVPTASRDVFLDDTEDVAAIHHQLELAVQDAKLHGSAIAIGHPHPATLQALAEYLPKLQRDGVSLVFASQVVH
jgi:polysaccharide deacetylase 2 family uncharacterized protein YibQ